MPDKLVDEEILSREQRDNANAWLIDFMQNSLKDGSSEIDKLRNRLSRSFRIILILSIVMFIIGIILLITPVIYAIFTTQITIESVGLGGLGIADLVALFFFRPIDQIRKIMGDMSQLTVTINSYQTQVSLRLLESDSSQRESLGDASKHISKISKDTLELIREYYEEIEHKSTDS